ncbi:hypothetical protein KSP39_PZI008484 [Platanthera zijinensis]|uniref:Uncharacterized protein n=1 Tax=Platanthera zijinensis TaxID=2320716 RepID=A0AAP0G8F8_9ASPA
MEGRDRERKRSRAWSPHVYHDKSPPPPVYHDKSPPPSVYSHPPVYHYKSPSPPVYPYKSLPPYSQQFQDGEGNTVVVMMTIGGKSSRNASCCERISLADQIIARNFFY